MARKRDHKPATSRTPQVHDFELWTRLRATVTPLHPQGPESQQFRPDRDAVQPDKPASTKPAGKPVTKVKAKPPQPAPVAPSPLTGLDRRTSQRLARGQIEVDARIDLHGESIETARTRLREFLMRSRDRGARTVLVITGKGTSEFARHTLHGTSHFHAPERQGRLRRMTTQWFHDPEFSQLISGFQPAHPKHGGGGAFYVRLRRAGAKRRSS